MTVKIKKQVGTVPIVPPKKKSTGIKTTYDVRISVYKSSRKRVAGKNEENGIVMFADSLFELFTSADTDRIALKKEGKQLYFIAKASGKFGDGTSCITHVENNKGKLQYSQENTLDILKQFIGEYSLEFDEKKRLYFVDLDHRTDLTNTFSGTYNVEHNYLKNKNVVDRGLTRKTDTSDATVMSVVDVVSVDPDVKLEAEKKTDAVNVNKDAAKAEIFQLLDVLGSDKTNTYAVALVNLIKEKVTAL